MTISGRIILSRIIPARIAPLMMIGLCAMLAGCASPREGAAPAEQKIATSILFSGRQLPEAKPVERDLGCPSASLLDGTGVYRSGDQGTARGISYQAWVNDIARECITQGNTMRIKVGVQGRFLLGDSGRPGSYTVPVRIAVRRGSETVSSRLVSASVTIPADDTQAPFVVVDENTTVVISALDPADEYKILVGIDPQGQRQASRQRRRR